MKQQNKENILLLWYRLVGWIQVPYKDPKIYYNKKCDDLPLDSDFDVYNWKEKNPVGKSLCTYIVFFIYKCRYIVTTLNVILVKMRTHN